MNIKVSRCGGFWKAQKMIALAEAMGLQCQIDDVAATRVTTTAAAHLACAVPIQTFFGYSVGPASQWLKRDVVRVGGITIERGNVHMPEGPGLGVSLAPDVIEEAAARVVGPMRRS